MNKADVVSRWKPELKALGFPYRRGVFECLQTQADDLRYFIGVQKNLHAETFKINLTIGVRNPLLPALSIEPLVMGNLREDTVRFRESRKSWWPPEALEAALSKLKIVAIPWFRAWGTPSLLSEKLEASIRDRKGLTDVLEPLTAAEVSALSGVWHRHTGDHSRLAPLSLYHASVLHYLSGNLALAVRRTRDWLSVSDKQESAKAEEQLARLLLLSDKESKLN